MHSKKSINQTFVLSNTKFRFFGCRCVLFGVFSGPVSLLLRDSLIEDEKELLGVNRNESLLEVDITNLLCANSPLSKKLFVSSIDSILTIRNFIWSLS